MKRKHVIDRVFKGLIMGVSGTSILALSAMIIFLFSQGLVPFFTSTAQSPRLIPYDISNFSVNGETIMVENLPRDAKYIELDGSGPFEIAFENNDESVGIRFELNPDVSKVADRVVFLDEGGGTVEYTEEYVYDISFSGRIAGQISGFFIALPIQPTRFFSDFLFGSEWRPTYNKQFGILTMVLATLLTTLGAIILGIPLALLVAVYLSEFIPEKLGRFVRSGIDLLAGIPSVVYGFFGLMVVVPLIKNISGAASGNSILAAILILSLMMLPTIISMSETSLGAVPRSLREGSLALGATHMQTSWRIVFPAARSGIIAGSVLGIARAVGETMAVIMVAGNSPQFPTRLTDGVRTLTATIALEMGYAQGRHNHILFSVGIVLFLLILTLNTVILFFKRRMEGS